MPSLSDFPAAGRILSASNGTVVFAPQGTTYQLHLSTPDGYAGPINQHAVGLIRLTAQKLYTIPSGGNFIVPIFGPPSIVQGRVKYLNEKFMIVQAGTPIIVDLPTKDEAIDLFSGPLALGALVNVVALPGAKFDLLPQPAASA